MFLCVALDKTTTTSGNHANMFCLNRYWKTSKSVNYIDLSTIEDSFIVAATLFCYSVNNVYLLIFHTLCICSDL